MTPESPGVCQACNVLTFRPPFSSSKGCSSMQSRRASGGAGCLGAIRGDLTLPRRTSLSIETKKNAKGPRDEERCGLERHNREEPAVGASVINLRMKGRSRGGGGFGWGGVRTETTRRSVIGPAHSRKPSHRAFQGRGRGCQAS